MRHPSDTNLLLGIILLRTVSATFTKRHTIHLIRRIHSRTRSLTRMTMWKSTWGRRLANHFQDSKMTQCRCILTIGFRASQCNHFLRTPVQYQRLFRVFVLECLRTLFTRTHRHFFSCPACWLWVEPKWKPNLLPLARTSLRGVNRPPWWRWVNRSNGFFLFTKNGIPMANSTVTLQTVQPLAMIRDVKIDVKIKTTLWAKRTTTQPFSSWY